MIAVSYIYKKCATKVGTVGNLQELNSSLRK